MVDVTFVPTGGLQDTTGDLLGTTTDRLDTTGPEGDLVTDHSDLEGAHKLVLMVFPEPRPPNLPPPGMGGQLPYCPNGSWQYTGMGQCVVSQSPTWNQCPSGTMGWAAGVGQCIVW